VRTDGGALAWWRRLRHADGGASAWWRRPWQEDGAAAPDGTSPCSAKDTVNPIGPGRAAWADRDNYCSQGARHGRARIYAGGTERSEASGRQKPASQH
jgi:hypothetical protein